jgi:hypothetical protein
MSGLEGPFDIIQQNLPGENISIRDLLNFPFPSGVGIPANDAHISHRTPNASIKTTTAILSVPAPSAAIIQDLITCIRSTSSHTAKSVAFKQSELADVQFYPLWIITYWSEKNRVLDIQRHWLRADENLKRLSRHGTRPTRKQVESVYDALSKMPWSGTVQGFHEQTETVHLHQYATTDWLHTVHQDQMLELLQQDVISHGPGGIVIKTTLFIPGIRKALLRNKTHGSLHNLGQSLDTGINTCVATIVNCYDTHWVAIVLDFSTHTIWHGDSLGWDMEADLRGVLDQWTLQHASAQFQHRKLPITHQPDSFSCGLFAWNALSHFLLPDQHPLLPSKDAAEGRLNVLLRICHHHQEEVSDSLRHQHMHCTYLRHNARNPPFLAMCSGTPSPLCWVQTNYPRTQTWRSIQRTSTLM